MDPRRLVSLSGFAAALFVAAGLLASIGGGILPALGAAWVAPLHVAVALLGVGAALVAAGRGREIEQERFAFTSDPTATRAERELAHKEAERALRLAHTALAAAPVALGYWLANELDPEVTRWGRALAGTAIAGYGLGMVLDRLRKR